MSALTPELARQTYLAMGAAGEADPLRLAVIRDLTAPGPAGPVRVRLYDARETRAPGPMVVFFHGGGFVIGDLDTHHAFCTEIAAALDLPVVAVDYRLAPEHPFPAAPDDCEAVTRWVATSPAELGRTVTGLILTGDSAGGNLTIVTTLCAAGGGARHPASAALSAQRRSPRPRLVCAIWRRFPADRRHDELVRAWLCGNTRAPAGLSDLQ
jgi:acetyl esterase